MDMVKDFKLSLKLKIGIPSRLQRLFFKGKQMEDLFPLSVYNIWKGITFFLAL